MSIKKYIALALLTALMNYPVYLGIKDINYSNQKHTYCGSVIDISTQLQAVKHGTRTDYYMLIAFDNIGTRLVDVSPETFYIYGKEGNRVCFDLSNDFVERLDTNLLILAGFSLGLIYDISILVLFVVNILFSDDSNKPRRREVSNWPD